MAIISKLHRRWNGFPSATSIVAVTAFAMKGDEERILEAGCDDYIPKPISVPVFLETVAKHLL